MSEIVVVLNMLLFKEKTPLIVCEQQCVPVPLK